MLVFKSSTKRLSLHNKHLVLKVITNKFVIDVITPLLTWNMPPKLQAVTHYRSCQIGTVTFKSNSLQLLINSKK